MVMFMHRNKSLWGPSGAMTSFPFIAGNSALWQRQNSILTDGSTSVESYTMSGIGRSSCLSVKVRRTCILHSRQRANLKVGLHLCIGRQMAYNQISYIVCKFFQNFSGVELAPDAQPSWSRPPASWKAPVQKGGLTDVGQRKARETVWSKIDVSTHTYVSCCQRNFIKVADGGLQGGLWVRTRGQDSE